MPHTALSTRDQDLIKAMRCHGYICTEEDGMFFLKAVPIMGYRGIDPPYAFNSVQGAADWLCPILRSHSFTAIAIG